MTTDNKFKLIPAIVEARKAKGWTQAELAKTMGVTQTTVSLMESGKREPRASLIEKAMQALGLSVCQENHAKGKTVSNNNPKSQDVLLIGGSANGTILSMLLPLRPQYIHHVPPAGHPRLNAGPVEFRVDTEVYRLLEVVGEDRDDTSPSWDVYAHTSAIKGGDVWYDDATRKKLESIAPHYVRKITLGEKIYKLQKRYGFHDSVVSERSGISLKRYEQIIYGGHEPTPRELVAFGRIFAANLTK
jgi:transcriptional regulator with XRE-family HTH domain